MYGINLSYPGPDSGPVPDHLDAVEDALAIREHSLSFWDADAAELVRGADPDDPYEHPSWDVHEALTGEDGWDDPSEAIEVRELLADEARLTPLAETPTARPVVRPVDAVLADRPTPAEELHTVLLALAGVDGSGLWPAYAERGEAA